MYMPTRVPTLTWHSGHLVPCYLRPHWCPAQAGGEATHTTARLTMGQPLSTSSCSCWAGGEVGGLPVCRQGPWQTRLACRCFSLGLPLNALPSVHGVIHTWSLTWRLFCRVDSCSYCDLPINEWIACLSNWEHILPFAFLDCYSRCFTKPSSNYVED